MSTIPSIPSLLNPKERILSLRDEGFDFDNIKENLDRAGSGKNLCSDA